MSALPLLLLLLLLCGRCCCTAAHANVAAVDRSPAANAVAVLPLLPGLLLTVLLLPEPCH
jgi:hypothetical protein